MAKESKPINLALQGGGSHGAFTWGVLDRLLEEEQIEIEAITGTSAGAMNATIMLQGLLNGGREGGKALLAEFWKKISGAGVFTPMQPTVIDRMIGRFSRGNTPATYMADLMSHVVSPYQYNPLGYNPLRDIIEQMVDFEAIRAQEEIKLFVNATNVKTGKIKIFENSELSVDMVMASACLPSLYQTVEVDGNAYWDGGYSGNPALYPLFYHCSSNDIVLVQINPINIDTVPKDANAIMDRINEISFNATLIREMRAIAFVKKLLREHKVEDDRYHDIRLHVIEAEDEMNDLSSASKFNLDWAFISQLRELGYNHADEWVASHSDKLGKESSIDIEKVYL